MSEAQEGLSSFTQEEGDYEALQQCMCQCCQIGEWKNIASTGVFFFW